MENGLYLLSLCVYSYIHTNVHSYDVFLSLLQEILRDEIKILQEKIEHHPDVTKYAMENLELRGLKIND